MKTKKAKWPKTAEHKIRKVITEYNANALFIDGFKDDPFLYDAAIVGITSGQGVTRIVYMAKGVVAAYARYIMAHEAVSEEEAYDQSQEWHDFNTFDAWHGESTPVFVTLNADIDE